jgi:hypothetical protein
MTRVLYRTASVLLVLYGLGHLLAYPWSDPSWGVDVGAMQSGHFNLLGFNRTYWDFYVGHGLFVSVLLFLGAVVAWQLGSLPAVVLRLLRPTAWAFSLCFAVLAALSWMYFFAIPIAFTSVITVLLGVAAWRSGVRPHGALASPR